MQEIGSKIFDGKDSCEEKRVVKMIDYILIMSVTVERPIATC